LSSRAAPLPLHGGPEGPPCRVTARRAARRSADAAGRGQLPWSSGGLRGLRSGASKSRRRWSPRHPSDGALAPPSVAGRWVLSCALRGLRPSPVRGPRGHHRGVASERRTARLQHSLTFPASRPASLPTAPSRPPHCCGVRLLRSVRTVAGPLAVWTDRSRSSDRAPRPCLSWGSRPVFAPPPTHPSRVHSRAGRLSTSETGGSEEPWADGTTRPASRSALVVSHHLDGFLRAKDRGLVASRYRSWGSPRFTETCSHDPTPTARVGGPPEAARRTGARQASFPATLRPFEEFPSFAAVRCHHRLLCLRAVRRSTGR
jgi:hypothetical protein